MKKILLLQLILAFASCGDKLDYEFDRFTLGSEKRYADYGDKWDSCFVTSINGNDVWGYFFYEIEGFEYRHGYEYLLHLKVRDAKTSDGKKYKRYILHREVSKIEKTSKDLPTEHKGVMLVASEMRMDSQASNAKKCYAVKVDDSKEWELIELPYIVLNKNSNIITEFDKGYEYKFEYLQSNVSGDNMTDGDKKYYRVWKNPEVTKKDSEGLPGYPVPEK